MLGRGLQAPEFSGYPHRFMLTDQSLFWEGGYLADDSADRDP